MSVELRPAPAVAAPRTPFGAEVAGEPARDDPPRAARPAPRHPDLGPLARLAERVHGGDLPSIRGSIDQIAKNYPAGLKEAFGVQAMNTVEGYIHAEMFSLIVPLAMGYFAIRAVAGAIVGAEERGYLDTILALPVSRTVLIAAITSSLRWLARRSWR